MIRFSFHSSLMFVLVCSTPSSESRPGPLMSSTSDFRRALLSERRIEIESTVTEECDADTDGTLWPSPCSMCDLFDATSTMMMVG